MDVWLLFYLSSIFQTSFFNFLFGLTQVPKSLHSKLKIYRFFQFGRILSCLLLLSLQSVEKEVLEKINIGLISLTIAGIGFEEPGIILSSTCKAILSFKCKLTQKGFFVMIWYHRSGLHDYILRDVQFYCSSVSRRTSVTQSTNNWSSRVS